MFESSEYAVESALREYFEGEKMNKQFTGVIERLFVNDRKTAKGDKKSISIANNKVYYGLGLHDTDTYQVGGVALKEGMEVSFEFTDGKYKNVILDTLKIVKTQPSKEFKDKVQKENVGMMRCHAFNGAANLLISEGLAINQDAIFEAAKIIHDVTSETKSWLATSDIGKNFDSKELGNTAGNAVINCSTFSTRDNLERNVKSFITNIVPLMTDYVSNDNKTQQKQEELLSQKSEADVGIDFDNDIPF